jgi:hypothetical protein
MCGSNDGHSNDPIGELNGVPPSESPQGESLSRPIPSGW